MKIMHAFPIIILLMGCSSKYKGTVQVCDKGLYVEYFNVNPAGVGADYLTDSTNFRLYVGKFDEDHENFSYVCKGDSIKIIKTGQDRNGQRIRLDSSTFSVSNLILKKTHDNDAVFEFK